MQFSMIALLSIVAVAIASPVAVALPERIDDIVARQTSGVASEAAAMTDASGNVVSFDSTAVFKDTTAKGN